MHGDVPCGRKVFGEITVALIKETVTDVAMQLPEEWKYLAPEVVQVALEEIRWPVLVVCCQSSAAFD